MPNPSRRNESAPRLWKRLLLWGIPAFFLLAIVAVFVVKAMIGSYLRSTAFRDFLAGRAGANLDARCELAPLHFTGMNLYTDGFNARGGADAAFSTLALDQVRADVSLRKFFDGIWRIEQVDMRRVQVNFDGERIATSAPDALPQPASTSSASTSSSGGGWLPSRVEIGGAVVHDTNLLWKGGALRGTTLTLSPGDGGWNIAGQGGKIEQTGVPALEVKALALRHRGDSLYVTDAEFRQGGEGSVKVDGEVRYGEQIDLRAAIRSVLIAPFLSEEWRLRLKGKVSGEITVRTPLPMPVGGPRITGSLALSEGELTSLPVLEHIATFTRIQQFRRLNLTRMSGDFDQSGAGLIVTKFVAESEGLIRIEGAFTVANSMIDGTFQVGVTPASLQWLPGSQARVFTESRGGYLWAPMRLTGPADKPQEDLSPRLIAAAQGAVIEGATKVLDGGIQTGKDVIKGALDLFLPGGK